MAGKWLSKYESIEPLEPEPQKLKLVIQSKADETETAIKQIYAGTYRRNCLLSVRESWHWMWGAAVWVCFNKALAEKKRADPAVEHSVLR